MTTWRQRNRDAFNALWRKWYAKNSARKIAWQKRRRQELRSWWQALKATKRCERCGETAIECLQFHHLDPHRKDLELAHAVWNGWSKDRILRAVAKCEVLCANCHAKLHWDERVAAKNTR